jgi:hypothetical protein
VDQKICSSRTRPTTAHDPLPQTENDTESSSLIAKILKTGLRSLTLPMFSQPPIISASSQISPTARHYHESLLLAPGLKKLIGNGRMVEYPPSDKKHEKLVHIAGDYSYYASTYAGNGWRIIGDAGGIRVYYLLI